MYKDPIEILDRIIEENESFRGITPDEAKIEQLNTMKAKAAEIAGMTRLLQNPPNPHDNHCRTASVLLRGEQPIVLLPNKVTRQIAELWRMADTVSIAYGEENGTIQFCFTVQNIWKEWTRDHGGKL